VEQDNTDPPPGGEPKREARFGDYVIVGTLGHGGFASVYRAEFRGAFGFRKQVALKVLHRRFDGSEDRATKDFLNEVRLGASIRHPHLVEFYECGRVGDRLYIAMELIDGPNLAQVLNLGGELPYPLGDDVILALAMQMARGLAGLHEAAVDDKPIRAIHRDLKPANILLSSQGQAKITDYGITRFAADFYQTLDNKGPRGSPLYMSPEQARGEALTQASDVFSFGTAVLEMVTGEPVFVADSVEAIIRRVREADVSTALHAARRRLPELAPVLENCLLPDPEGRYASGAELVEGMRGIEPPKFGSELVAKVGAGANETLAAMDLKRRKQPTEQYWCMLRDLEREPGPQQAQRAATTDDDPPTLGPEPEAAAEPPPEPEPRTEPHEHARSLSLRAIDTSDFLPAQAPAQAPAPAPAAEPRPAARLWQIAALALLVLVFVALLVGVLTAPDVAGWLAADSSVADEPSVPDQPAAAADDPVEGVEAAEATTPAAAGHTPTDDAIAADEPAAAASEPTAEAAEVAEAAEAGEAGAGPPRLYHEPVTRGIRGQSVRFEVAVDPPGAYRSTVWYRAVPEGPWQKRNVDSGTDGTLQVVIPAGEWLGQETAEVEYFIEVGGVGGMARSGSAVKPYRFALF